MTSAPPLRLFLFSTDDEFDDALPSTAQRPAELAAAPPRWQPRLDDALLWLEGAPDPLVMSPFGRLEMIAPQLEEAANRLEAGRRALLRSAGEAAGVFLALEPVPSEENAVAVAQLAQLPEPWGSYYPLEHSFFYPGRDVDQRAALYDYVDEHRDALVPRHAQDGRPIDRLRGLRWDRRATVAALREEAAGARALLDSLTTR